MEGRENFNVKLQSLVKFIHACLELEALWHTGWRHSLQMPFPFFEPAEFNLAIVCLSTKQKRKQQVMVACANSSREMPPLPSLSILLNKSPPDAFRSMTSHVKERKIKINTKMGYQFQPSSKNQSRPHHLCSFFLKKK